jgi:hypothetical protein
VTHSTLPRLWRVCYYFGEDWDRRRLVYARPAALGLVPPDSLWRNLVNRRKILWFIKASQDLRTLGFKKEGRMSSWKQIGLLSLGVVILLDSTPGKPGLPKR